MRRATCWCGAVGEVRSGGGRPPGARIPLRLPGGDRCQVSRAAGPCGDVGGQRHVQRAGEETAAAAAAQEVSLSAAMKTIGPAFARCAWRRRGQAAATARPSSRRTRRGSSRRLSRRKRPGTTWVRAPRPNGLAPPAITPTPSKRAAAAGDWDAVKTSSGALNTLCQNCHGSNRERQEDGTFRVKPGAFCEVPPADGVMKAIQAVND